MKLNRVVAGAMLAALFALPMPSWANDPCEVTLCMWGAVSGVRPSECSSSYKKYFSIIYKKRGKIRWDQTASAREQYLNQCPSADRSSIKMIQSKFGKSLG
jgi:hypothetical protein